MVKKTAQKASTAPAKKNSGAKKAASATPSVTSPKSSEMKKLSGYIHNKWDDLVRTHEDLFFGMLVDEKVPLKANGEQVLYVSRMESPKKIATYLEGVRKDVVKKVKSGEIKGVKPEDVREIKVKALPKDQRPVKHDEHGLLYLPYPYVVPGGRFNETYGWDSAFIVRGLVLDNHYDLAKQVVDNKIYSIQHYGMILNANRSYFLGRSQAPFLTNKVLDIYRHYDKLTETGNQTAIEWLKSTLEGVEAYYRLWTRPPYIHRASGLSYYNDMDETPAIEVEFSEKGHYEGALQKLRQMHLDKLEREEKRKNEPPTYQDRKDAYYLSLYYQAERPGLTKKQIETLPLEEKDLLTEKFYRGDRAMRASGFDPSRRFGFFNVDVIHHLPVCLNCLLYIMEMEMAEIHGILAKEDPEGRNHEGHVWAMVVRKWKDRASRRKRRINRWLWDEATNIDIPDAAADYPGYRDYNIHYNLCNEHNIPFHRNYVFASAFYPLWAGIASDEQAAQVVKHIYPRLITQHGLMTSDRETGSQWDAPFAWAPMQIIAVRGLLRYGYTDEALAIAYGFLNTVNTSFKETGKIFEKYDMESGSHKVSEKIDKGYSVNVEGFGWTNAVVLELLQLVEKHGKLS